MPIPKKRNRYRKYIKETATANIQPPAGFKFRIQAGQYLHKCNASTAIAMMHGSSDQSVLLERIVSACNDVTLYIDDVLTTYKNVVIRNIKHIWFHDDEILRIVLGSGGNFELILEYEREKD